MIITSTLCCQGDRYWQWQWENRSGEGRIKVRSECFACLFQQPPLALTCSPADPRSARRPRSSAPAIHWARTDQSAACCCTTGPTGCRAALWSSPCSADTQRHISGCRVSRCTNRFRTSERPEPDDESCGGGWSWCIPVASVPAGWGWPCLSSLCPSNTWQHSPLWRYHWQTQWHERLLRGSWTCTQEEKAVWFPHPLTINLHGVKHMWTSCSPNKWVAFVWENSDFHDLTKGREGLSHNLLCEHNRNIRALRA